MRLLLLSPISHLRKRNAFVYLKNLLRPIQESASWMISLCFCCAETPANPQPTNDLAAGSPFGHRFALQTGMKHVDLERRIALTELMDTPDPPDIKRGHRQKFEGRPDRFEMLPTLAMLFAQTRLIEFQERADYRS